MVAHGANAAMAQQELQQYVPLGSIVTCKDPYGMCSVQCINLFYSVRSVYNVAKNVLRISLSNSLRGTLVIILFYFQNIFYSIRSVHYISYRVRGLYRLGKTCYLHSLLCNNSIIAHFFIL